MVYRFSYIKNKIIKEDLPKPGTIQNSCEFSGDSNQGPLDLQSNALPTELFRHMKATHNDNRLVQTNNATISSLRSLLLKSVYGLYHDNIVNNADIILTLNSRWKIEDKEERKI